MGSTDRGLIAGYICRLCSKMNRYVILIYSQDGKNLNLAHKINSYLPITVDRGDTLPKTVCVECVQKLESQHEMMEMLNATMKRIQGNNSPVKCTASVSSR